MDATTKDWLIVGCSLVSLCASLSAPVTMGYIGRFQRSQNAVRVGRRETYTTLLALAARASDRFQSASIRQKLQRLRPENPEISVQVDADVSDGWTALEELSHRLQVDQLLCSDKVISLISEAKAKHFWNAESLFSVCGHAALNLDELHKDALALCGKLKQHCRREIGLYGQH